MLRFAQHDISDRSWVVHFIIGAQGSAQENELHPVRKLSSKCPEAKQPDSGACQDQPGGVDLEA